jgi:hypothetical protein
MPLQMRVSDGFLTGHEASLKASASRNTSQQIASRDRWPPPQPLWHSPHSVTFHTKAVSSFFALQSGGLNPGRQIHRAFASSASSTSSSTRRRRPSDGATWYSGKHVPWPEHATRPHRSGGCSGLTARDLADHVEKPLTFLARTLNVYDRPFVSDVIVATVGTLSLACDGVVGSTAEVCGESPTIFVPATFARSSSSHATSYARIGSEPSSSGISHETWALPSNAAAVTRVGGDGTP